MTFDPTKPVQTRNGRKARILATDIRMRSGLNITAVVEDSDGYETVFWYQPDGKLGGGTRDSAYDLFNAPERKSIFFNYYPDKSSGGSTYDTMFQALAFMGAASKGTAEVVFENDIPVSVLFHPKEK